MVIYSQVGGNKVRNSITFHLFSIESLELKQVFQFLESQSLLLGKVNVNEDFFFDSRISYCIYCYL